MNELPEPEHRLPPEARGYWRISGLLSSLPVFAAALWLGSYLPGVRLLLVLAALAVVVVAVVVVPPLRYRRWRYAIREHEIDLSHGTLVARRTLVPMRRVQHVETESGPLQGSYGLASVSFHTAAGALEIPALKQWEAEEVRRRIGELAAAERDDAAT